MVDKKVKEEVLPPEGKTKKHKAFTANKKNLFILKLTAFALISLNIVILSAVFWNRYLEPKFGFDFVSSGQPVAEAMSLAPIVNDTPPSTFQGEPEPADPTVQQAVPQANPHESLLKEIVDAIQGKISNEPPSELLKLQEKVNRLEQSLANSKGSQILNLVESGVVTIPQLREFLNHYPDLPVSELRAVLAQHNTEFLLNYSELEAHVVAAQTVQVDPQKKEKFFSQVKSWFKSLVKVEKEGANTNPDVNPQFLEAIRSHDVVQAIQHYQTLPDDIKSKLAASVYSQLLLRDALFKAQRELILKNISQG